MSEQTVTVISTILAHLPGVPFAENYLKQDAIAINMQRACEQAIDLANYPIKSRKLGLPRESRESFRLLADGNIIPQDLANKLGKMVGFRNTLVREYQELNLRLMVDVIEKHLDDLLDFANYIAREFAEREDA
jgi:uncharacterized protein YutE (UPF0331/DUF86 family)